MHPISKALKFLPPAQKGKLFMVSCYSLLFFVFHYFKGCAKFPLDEEDNCYVC